MKKILRLAIVSALTLVTVLSLVACTVKDPNTDGTSNTAVSTANKSETTAPDPADTSNSNTNQSSNAETTAADPEKTSFVRGTVNGNVYRSDFVGVTFTKPDNWRFNTDEEIAQLLGIGLDILQSGDKFDASTLASTIDFQALDPVTGNNVNMVVEKLNAINAVTLSIDDYIKAFRNALITQSQGMSATFGDTTETTIGGNTYKRITANLQMSSVNMQQVYLLRKVGKYVVCITVTSANGTDVSSLEAMLS